MIYIIYPHVWLWNHAWIRSFNQLALSNEGIMSCSRKQWQALMWFEPTTDRLCIRRVFVFLYYGYPVTSFLTYLRLSICSLPSLQCLLTCAFLCILDFLRERFPCDECGKDFSSKSNLRQHKSVHSNDKPYQCPQCSKQFSQLRYLRQHLAFHISPSVL